MILANKIFGNIPTGESGSLSMPTFVQASLAAWLNYLKGNSILSMSEGLGASGVHVYFPAWPSPIVSAPIASSIPKA